MLSSRTFVNTHPPIHNLSRNPHRVGFEWRPRPHPRHAFACAAAVLFFSNGSNAPALVLCCVLHPKALNRSSRSITRSWSNSRNFGVEVMFCNVPTHHAVFLPWRRRGGLGQKSLVSLVWCGAAPRKLTHMYVFLPSTTDASLTEKATGIYNTSMCLMFDLLPFSHQVARVVSLSPPHQTQFVRPDTLLARGLELNNPSVVSVEGENPKTQSATALSTSV